MNTKFVPVSFRVLFTILIALIILASSIVGHRIYLLKFKAETVLKPSSYYVDTNFIKFEVESQPVKNVSATLLLESKSVNSKTVLLIISDRKSGELNTYVRRMNQDGSIRLFKNSTYKLSQFVDTNSYTDSSLYVFDLMIDKSVLYLSLVEIPRNRTECDLFKVLSINISELNLDSESLRQVWQSSTCTKSFPNNPGWNDFHGRLAYSNNFIYLTAGLLIASTYQGLYPNPNIYNLDPDLFREIGKDKLFGSIIQINKVSGESREFATGFRGPSGITILKGDKGEESIWVVDHGPRGGDELNLIQPGAHYGWPYVSLGSKYFIPAPQDSKTLVIPTKFGTHEGYTIPKYVWTPSVAPSTITNLSADIDSSGTWTRGDLLIGTLKGNSLIHIKLDKDRVLLAEEVYLGVRIRDISVNNDLIFVSTDDGRILTLSPKAITAPNGPFPDIYPKAKYFYLKIPGMVPVIAWVDTALRKFAAQW